MHFARELPHVTHAAKVESAFVAKEIRVMQQKLNILKIELEAQSRARARVALTTDNKVPSVAYYEQMQAFMLAANARVAAITRRHDTATDVTLQLAYALLRSSPGYLGCRSAFFHL